MLPAMVASLTDAPVPLGEHVPTADQRIVLWNQTWESYEMLLALRGERPRPLMAYLDGAIELMATSRTHEWVKSAIGQIVSVHCLDRGIQYMCVGSYTIRRNMAQAGAEPDECYVFGENLRERHPPDLVIEVVWTSGGLDKLEIYKRLRVGEVWFWENDTISVHVLDAGRYERRQRSACLPDLDLELVCEALQLDSANTMIARMRAGR
jgi:Uma2 family endonuclease